MAEDGRAHRGGDDRRGGRGGYGRSEGGRPEHRERRDDRPRRSEDREGRPSRDRDDRPKRYNDRDDRPRRQYGDRDDRPRRQGDRDERPRRDRDDRPRRQYGDRDDRPRRQGDQDDRPRRQYGDRDDRPRRQGDRDDRPRRQYGDRDDRPRRHGDRDDRPRRGRDDRRGDRPRGDRRDDRGDDQLGRDGRPRRGKDALRPLEEREAGHEGPIRLGESDEAPDLPEGPEYGFDELDKETRAGLRSLNKQLAEAVGNRLIATAALLEAGDAEGALVQARYARRKASRVASVREVTGVAAYSAGEWQLAMNELRAAERLGGNRDHVAMIADCERATGHPERAVDLYREFGNDKNIDPQVRVELLIVAAGARRDMGMGEAATAMLKVKALNSPKAEQWVARLRFAYAEQLIADGRVDEAGEWLSKAVAADEAGVTGAAERLLELEGVDFDELDEEPDEDDEETPDPEESDDETDRRE